MQCKLYNVDYHLCVKCNGKTATITANNNSESWERVWDNNLSPPPITWATVPCLHCLYLCPWIFCFFKAPHHGIVVCPLNLYSMWSVYYQLLNVILGMLNRGKGCRLNQSILQQANTSFSYYTITIYCVYNLKKNHFCFPLISLWVRKHQPLITHNLPQRRSPQSHTACC